MSRVSSLPTLSSSLLLTVLTLLLLLPTGPCWADPPPPNPTSAPPSSGRAAGYPRVGDGDPAQPEQADETTGDEQDSKNSILTDEWKQSYPGEAHVVVEVAAASYTAEGYAAAKPDGATTYARQDAWCADKPFYVVDAPEKWIVMYIQNSVSADATASVGSGEGSKVYLRCWSIDIFGREHKGRLSVTATGSSSTSSSSGSGQTSTNKDSAGTKVAAGGTGFGVEVKLDGEESSNSSTRQDASRTQSGSSNVVTATLYNAIVEDFACGWDHVQWGPRQISSGGKHKVMAQSNGSSVSQSDFDLDVDNHTMSWAYVYGVQWIVESPRDPYPTHPAPAFAPHLKLAILPPTTLPDTPLKGNVVLASASHGLEGETGSRAGVAAVVLDGSTDTALRFALSSVPAGRVSFPGGPTLEIPAGRRSAAARFAAQSAGSVTIEMTLLDAAGEPTDTVLSLSAETQSTASVSAPVISVHAEGELDDDGSLAALPGERACTLFVARTGFASLDSTATTLALAASDPQSILADLPSEITIEAGEGQASLDVRTTSAVGVATVEVKNGEEVLETLTIRTRAPAFEPTGGVRVPVDARRAYVQFETRTASEAAQVFTGVSQDPGIAAVVAPGTVSLAPGCRIQALEIDPVAVGTTAVVVDGPGSSTTTLGVTVVPSEVSVSATTLSLSNLASASGGRFDLTLPEGAAFTSVTPPLGVENVSIEGVGTRTVTIRIGSGAPATLAFAIGLSGNPTEVAVFDQYHAADWRFPYFVAVE